MSNILINTGIATAFVLAGAYVLEKYTTRKDLMKLYAVTAAVCVVAVAGISAFGAAFAGIYFGAIIGAMSFAQPHSPTSKKSIIHGAIIGTAVGGFIAFAFPAPTNIAVINGQVNPVFPIN